MYENVTYESILARMLDRIPNDYDKREGSVIYDAIAPAALEFMNMYLQIETVLLETFADTQSRQYLIKRCSERGVNVEPATYAIRQGEFNIDVPLGSRFSLNNLNYIAIEKISDGIFKMQCEETGVQGNEEFGTLIPIDYIQGLQTATLTDILVPGEDEEDTEHLRNRYFESLESQSFGGNIADYKKKTVELVNGVGDVKVYPVWNGGGTVKLVIINSDYAKPSPTLINETQTAVDPIQNQGQGVGFAPIGHTVTVFGCEETRVDITIQMNFEEGWNWDRVKDDAEKVIVDYFTELSKTWGDSENLVVKVSQIERRLLDLPGVSDVGNATLNQASANLTLNPDNIPVKGAVTYAGVVTNV